MLWYVSFGTWIQQTFGKVMQSLSSAWSWNWTWVPFRVTFKMMNMVMMLIMITFTIMIMQTNTQPDEQQKLVTKTSVFSMRFFPLTNSCFFFSKKNGVFFQLLRGIDKLAETVAVTLGPRGRNVLLDKAGLVMPGLRLVMLLICYNCRRNPPYIYTYIYVITGMQDFFHQQYYGDSRNSKGIQRFLEIGDEVKKAK